MRTSHFILGGVAVGLGVACSVPLQAQDVSQWGNWPGGLATFSNANVTRSGQPVIPVFEGWHRRPDGTAILSFGYFNLNIEEVIYIPLGPDNFIEPREFDGMQPTHFLPAPEDGRTRRRHHSVFAVTIPADYRGDVVWTLRVRGQTFSVPGRATVPSYLLEDLQSLNDSPVAAELRFPDGATGRGRVGPMTGPLTVAVGQPLPLTVWVDPQPSSAVIRADVWGPAAEPRTSSRINWYLHQGPGEVTFSDPETVVEVPEGAAPAEVTTTATFSEPGDYLLRVMANETVTAFVQYCCWTNGYVRVTVTPS